VFFGTPHRAVDIHSWEELVFNIAFTSTQRPGSGFSKAVRESAKALLELSEEFYVVAGKYNILDIYAEGQGSTVGRPINIYNISLYHFKPLQLWPGMTNGRVRWLCIGKMNIDNPPNIV
jgi:hypothetical protein